MAVFFCFGSTLHEGGVTGVSFGSSATRLRIMWKPIILHNAGPLCKLQVIRCSNDPQA